MIDTAASIPADKKQVSVKRYFAVTDTSVYNVTSPVLKLFQNEISRDVSQAFVIFDAYIVEHDVESAMDCSIGESINLTHGLPRRHLH